MSEVAWSSTAVAGDDPDDGAAAGGGLGDDLGVDDVGVGRGEVDDLSGPRSAGTVTNSGAAAPGPNDSTSIS